MRNASVVWNCTWVLALVLSAGCGNSTAEVENKKVNIKAQAEDECQCIEQNCTGLEDGKCLFTCLNPELAACLETCQGDPDCEKNCIPGGSISSLNFDIFACRIDWNPSQDAADPKERCKCLQNCTGPADEQCIKDCFGSDSTMIPIDCDLGWIPEDTPVDPSTICRCLKENCNGWEDAECIAQCLNPELFACIEQCGDDQDCIKACSGSQGPSMIDLDSCELDWETDEPQCEDNDPNDAGVIPPAGVSILQSIHGGNGCPHNANVEVSLAADASAFRFKFEPMHMDSTSGIGRKFCDFVVELEVPDGYEFAVSQAAYKGSYDLGSNTSARHSVSAFFAFGDCTPTIESEINGETKNSFDIDEPFERIMWSGCGKNKARLLHLKTTGLVHSRENGQKASLTIDSVGDFHIKWRKCN